MERKSTLPNVRGVHVKKTKRWHAACNVLLRRVDRAEVEGLISNVVLRWATWAAQQVRDRDALSHSADWRAVQAMADCLHSHPHVIRSLDLDSFKVRTQQAGGGVGA